MGNERGKINQRWKGEWIWNLERTRKKLIKAWKKNKYESGKGKGKNKSKVERRINIMVGKQWERMN